MTNYIQRLFDRAAVSSVTAVGNQTSSDHSSLHSSARSDSPLADHDQRLLDPKFSAGIATPLYASAELPDERQPRYELTQSNVKSLQHNILKQTEHSITLAPKSTRHRKTEKLRSKRRHQPEVHDTKNALDKLSIPDAVKPDSRVPIVKRELIEKKALSSDIHEQHSYETSSNNLQVHNNLQKTVDVSKINTRNIQTIEHPAWQPMTEPEVAEKNTSDSLASGEILQDKVQSDVSPAPLLESNRVAGIETVSPENIPAPAMVQVPQTKPPEPLAEKTPAPQKAEHIKVIEKIVNPETPKRENRPQQSGPLTAHSISKIGTLPQRRRSFSVFGIRRS